LQKKGYKFFLSNNIKLALNLKLDGAIFLPLIRINHLSYSFTKNFIILGSAHNNKEIKVNKTKTIS
jgi:thiamine-phosphate pyrophosphorylase